MLNKCSFKKTTIQRQNRQQCLCLSTSICYTRVNLYTINSLNLYDGLDIFVDLKLLDPEKENEIKQQDIVCMIQNCFTINMIEKRIIIKGYKLSDSSFLINNNGGIKNIRYTCSNEVIKTGVEYLYTIRKNTIS